MSFYLIRTIARCEMKILLRSWFFRIFAGMVIIGLSIFNIAMNIEQSGAPWIYRALPASIPYANLIILNLGQAIVAIFLASEFLKQDKKNDTVEVIYARSMTNGEYILGKTLGILLVFFVLNIIVLLIGIGFSFLSNDTSRSAFSLLAYPLLISLPTLVFILGLSFFLMIILKNQAITFLLLLGYIALTVFYLSSKAYHLFDFIAYHVPMMYSSISGFSNMNEILLHRGIFFFAGIALIFFTVYKLPRLPQSRTFAMLPLFLVLLFLAVSGFLMYLYINIRQSQVTFKEQILNLNNQYANYPKLTVLDCEINLQHQNQTITVNSVLKLQNKNTLNIDTIILSLNPSLNVSSVFINDKDANFTKSLQIVKILCQQSIKPNEFLDIQINYGGTINEDVCFIDHKPETFSNNFVLEMLNLRKRFSFLQSNFVCLTREALWYPITGVGYATNKPMYYLPDFTKFTVKVKTAKGLMAVCQGKASQLKDGTFQFETEMPLPKISLMIGNYSKHSITVDSIEYNLFTIKGNQYYSTYFSNINDTLSSIIKGLKVEYEVKTKLKYQFKRFSLVEVPVLFALDKHIYSITSDAVQPEMVLYPEKGVLLSESDFRKRKKRTEDEMKRNNEEVLPEDLQTRMFQQCIRRNFTVFEQGWYNYDEIIDADTYTLFPELYTFGTQLNADKFPILNFAFDNWMKKKSGIASSARTWFWEGMSRAERINVELIQASLKQLMDKGIENKEDDRNPIQLREVIQAKGLQLFDVWSARFGEKQFYDAIFELIEKHKFENISFELLDSVIQAKFGSSIQADIQIWYEQSKLPGFIIKDMTTYSIVQKELTQYQVRFKIANPEPVDGLITLNIELEDKKRATTRQWWEEDNIIPDLTKAFYIEADTAKEIGFISTTLPVRMSLITNVSENLPNIFKYDFNSFSEVRRVPSFDSVTNIPLFDNGKIVSEIIVDNEDIGFHIEESENRAYLKSVFNKQDKRKYNYSAVRDWDLPGFWVPVLQTGNYGQYIHSAHYTKAGTGDRKAIWQAQIQQSSIYDIYFHSTKRVVRRNDRQENSGTYAFNIFTDDGIEKVELQADQMEDGWNFLGAFFISKGNAKVELSNKTGGDVVFADAVKWVQVKK